MWDEGLWWPEMTMMRIKQAAEASGFTTAALRYYERIGLVPEPARTSNGYRLYDDHALTRLGFIARAKALGCTLDEIAALTPVLDGAECGPLQDRFGRLVAAKIDAAQHQIAELTTLVVELGQAANGLEQHRPEGPCDVACGCLGAPRPHAETEAEPETKPTDDRLPVSAQVSTSREPGIACTLTTEALRRRLTDWHGLAQHVDIHEPIDDGVRCVFADTVPTAQLMRLVMAEQACCQFLRFAITVDTRGTALEVRCPDDARELVEALFRAAA